MAIGTAILGIVGLALDCGVLYGTKQRAQAAADAAAQAGVMDLYRGNGTAAASASAKAYGQKNGFLASEVDPEYPSCSSLGWCNGHVTLSGDNPNLIQVTVTRVVNTVFLRALNVNTATVKAVGTAAITVELEPVPILVLHPTASGSFSKNGSNSIAICGGPTRSIQVNSTSTTSINISGASGTVDLSHGGPLDPGDCSAGTGSDFANAGLQNPYPGTLLLGTKPGQYVSPASPIADPLLGVAAPAQPANAPTPLPVCGPPSSGALQKCPLALHNCPPTLGNNDTCLLYSPGYYPNGITVKGSQFAQFRAGIYWINHGGFQLQSNSAVRMAQGADASDPLTGTGWSGQMLIYNSPSIPVSTSNDILSIDSNSGKWNGSPAFPTADCPNGGNCLVGSPSDSTYKSILFFQNRWDKDPATATTLHHSLQGGGGLTLKGTIYLTHTAAATATDGKYQSLSLQGNAGGVTKLLGEIIVDELSLGGSSAVTMNLSSPAIYPVRQVALVQ
jgi:Flp pilus assembly protein TadG